jgi:hypothetical protein
MLQDMLDWTLTFGYVEWNTGKYMGSKETEYWKEIQYWMKPDIWNLSSRLILYQEWLNEQWITRNATIIFKKLKYDAYKGDKFWHISMFFQNDTNINSVYYHLLTWHFVIMENNNI